jgi:hypothetical protein
MEGGETVSSTVSDSEFAIRACALHCFAGLVRTLMQNPVFISMGNINSFVLSLNLIKWLWLRL